MGEADGQQVNIPVLANIAMGRRRSERSAYLRNSTLKLVDIGLAGKSAGPVEGDSTVRLRTI